MKTVWEQQKSCCKCLATFHFVLWDITLHFPFFPQNGLKQPWLLRRSMKELLAHKSFCWSSRGCPEHALERGVSSATAGETASPTHCSLKSKQRGFVAPGNFCLHGSILFCWPFLPLLALRLQKSASLQSSDEEQKQGHVSASVSLSPALITLWKNRKHFLADSVEYGSCSNTSKTWSGKHEEVASTSVRNLGSTARLSSHSSCAALIRSWGQQSGED